MKGAGHIIAMAWILFTNLVAAQAAHPPVTTAFDDWPATATWTTYSLSNGWSMVDAQIRNARGWTTPYSVPQAAWLQGSNLASSVQSPPLSNGIESLSFWTRQFSPAGGTGVVAVLLQNPTNGWDTLSALVVTNAAWERREIPVGAARPVAVRLAQLAAQPDGLSIGLDDVVILVDPAPLPVDPWNTARREFGPCSRRTPLTISEIMYHPPRRADAANLEYVELFNSEPVPQDLTGYRLAGDVDYAFPSNTILPARGYLVVAAAPAAMQSAYGLATALGPWTNSLPNDSGVVRLRNEQDAILLEVEYRDSAPWPVAADGAGHALSLQRPDLGERDPRAWGAGRFPGGSPGAADPDYRDPRDGVVINEFRSHTDWPVQDFIELYNTADHGIDLSGCTLSDDPETNRMAFAAGTVLPPGGFLCVYEESLGFLLSSGGDEIVLRAPSGGRVLDALRFDALPNGASVGRAPDGAASIQPLAAPTPGAANAPAALPAVIIDELMYAPISGLADDEYVELFNPGTQAVSLADWRLDDGVAFTFPAGASIPAGAYVVVAHNITNLLARYPHLTAASAFGGYRGQLSDRGERVALLRPEDPARPYENFVVVDDVLYADGWADWTDGGGSSLELIDPRSDNTLGMNWAASDETTKAPWTTVNVTGTLSHGNGGAGELQIVGLQAGEYLFDNIEVFTPSGANRILNPTFDDGTDGWEMRGNHVRSAWEAGGGFASAGCLHVRASDRGDVSGTSQSFVWYNQVATELSTPLSSGNTVTIRAKARWLRGWPFATLSVSGDWMEAVVPFALPAQPGTPGLPNSAARTNAGPAIADVQHTPLLPAALQAITVRCRLSDPDGITNAWIAWRLDPTGAVAYAALHDDGLSGDATPGDGLYAAALPGQATGALLAFTVHAADGAPTSAESRYPAADGLECLVRVGESAAPGVFGGYRLWLTASNLNAWAARDPHDNEPVPATFVYDGARAVYEATGRYRGGWRNFTGPNGAAMCNYAVTVAKRDRVLGENELKLDMTGQESSDSTRQVERFSMWFAQQLGMPHHYLRLVNVWVNGTKRQPLHDYQTPAIDFVRSWYPDDPDPCIFKQINENALDVFLASDGTKAQWRYRDRWRKRRTDVPSDDFSRLYNLVDAFALTNPSLYQGRTTALANMTNWMSYFAINHALGNRDSWGYDWHHNTSAYLPDDAPARLFLLDMDFAFEQPNTDSLFRNDDATVQRMYDHAPFRRLYWRVLLEAANGPMLATAYNTILDPFEQAMQSNAVTHAPASTLKTWLDGRRTYILSQAASAGLNVPFAITSNGGTDFATSAALVALGGSAPVEVASIRINGAPFPAAFTGLTTWVASVPLQPGPNALALEGLDRFGRVVGTDSITITTSAAWPDPAGRVVINELMVHAPGDHADYLELHNRSATDTVDLSGWRIDGVDFTFPPGSVMSPGSYRVIADNITTYAMVYTNVECLIGTYDGELDNAGERVALLRPVGTDAWSVVESVTYDDTAPWPLAADGQGPSLQRIDAAQEAARAGNWACAAPPAAIRTPGAANSVAASLPPFPALWITEIMASNLTSTVDNAGDHDPWLELYNGGTQALDLSACFLSNAADDLRRSAFPAGTAIAGGERMLVWLDGETNETSATGIHTTFAIHSVSGSVFLALGLLHQTVLLDYLHYGPLAPDTSCGRYPDDVMADTVTVFHYPTPGLANSAIARPARITINEWLADNAHSLPDPADSRFQDWIELHNADAERVHLGGYALSDRPATSNRFIIPGGVWIDAGGFLLVWTDGEPAQNAPGRDLHTDFSLNKSGESVALFATDGSLLDSIAFGPQQEDVSEGRWPDGTGEARTLWHPTPGQSNRVYTIVALQAAPPPGGVTLSSPARPGHVYALTCAEDLLLDAWHIEGVVTAASSTVSISDTNAIPGGTRYYRLVEIE